MNKGLVRLGLVPDKPTIFHSECTQTPNITNVAKRTDDAQSSSNVPKKIHKTAKVMHKPILIDRLKKPAMNWDKIQAGCQFIDGVDEKMACLKPFCCLINIY